MFGRRHGILADLFKLLALCVILVYGVVGVTSPWAFHIGGRWTPLLYWSGYGKLVTKTGTQIHFAPVIASLYWPVLIVAFICLAQHWINLVQPGWRWLPPLTGIVTSLAGVCILYPLLKHPDLITITDLSGAVISKGGTAGLYHLVSKGLWAVLLGMLIVGSIYAWQLLWIVWQSMPRPPAAPNGRGIPLV